MKKEILLSILLFCTLSVYSVPAKKGITKMLTLLDGTTITATLCGDEYGHYWKSDDGRKFRLDDNQIAKEITDSEFVELSQKKAKRMSSANKSRSKRLQGARRVGTFGSYIGEKKGLVILVEFNNLSMKPANTQMEFDDMFNQVGYRKHRHIGSVHDYFYDQSYGLFDLSFDVVGPVQVSHSYSYYGQNNSAGDDKNACSMVIEACNMVDSLVNFADYDWDGDGEVEQVYLVYAGYGENAGASSDTIWPQEWQLSEGADYGDGEGAITLDGVLIDTYAVSCELAGKYGSDINGIGTACHEFSHCLGYPDFYDTDYSGGVGMKAWDVLDQGSYNGPNYHGEVPAGYTSYERWVAGWLEPTELRPGEPVDSLKPLNDYPQAYIAYNDNNPDEYYLFENRAPSRWFSYNTSAKVSKKGMLVIHVDYNADSWINNTPNDNPNHQRMSVVCANSNAHNYTGNLYPYYANDSLTNKSTPATDLYVANKAGKKYLPVSIHNIKVEADGNVTFTADEPYYKPLGPVIDPESEDIVFYESFNKCNGTGGNDDLWSGGVANSASKFVPDNEGWTSNKYFGGYECAKFGTSTVAGEVTSPEFEYTGDVTIHFNAGAWNSSSEPKELTVSINSEPVEVFEMERGEWTAYKLSATLEGLTTITFTPGKRFFLDEVVVFKTEEVDDAIKTVNKDKANDNRIYSISGQYIGNDMNTLPSGIYIKNGKRMLKL